MRTLECLALSVQRCEDWTLCQASFLLLLFMLSYLSSGFSDTGWFSDTGQFFRNCLIY